MKALIRHVSLVLSVLLALPLPARAEIIQPLPGKSLPAAPPALTARGVNVEAALQNQQPAFLVRVSVDRADATYEAGELMQVSVESEKTGFLYLLYKQADGSDKCLFPNKFDVDNAITGGRKITLPTATSRFQLRIAPPLGDELLIALVTREPLTGATFGARSLTDSVVTDVDVDTLIAKGVNVELRNKPSVWAEHCLRIRTVPARSREVKPAAHRRLALFIGISEFRDERIPPLSLCHRDAEAMARVMREHGRLDGCGLLLNDQATRAAIQRAFQELLLKSQPGDEIFIYWSTHGATCADTSGDERVGRDEFLVTYDGNPEDIAGTMVLDDTLGRWVQALDGRKVCLIVDACHSAGQAGGRSVADPAAVSDWGTIRSPDDFLGAHLGRIKDIGQHDAAMLFSSDSDQISAERQDGTLSVMTYFLEQKLRSSRTLTLAEAYEHVRVEVPKYMQVHYPGRDQTPQIVPEHGGRNVRLR